MHHQYARPWFTAGLIISSSTHLCSVMEAFHRERSGECRILLQDRPIDRPSEFPSELVPMGERTTIHSNELGSSGASSSHLVRVYGSNDWVAANYDINDSKYGWLCRRKRICRWLLIKIVLARLVAKGANYVRSFSIRVRNSRNWRDGRSVGVLWTFAKPLNMY